MIQAGLVVFARDGFDAASTRQIVELARVNLAQISYHFGGKEGLHLAVFEHLSRQAELRLGPIAEELQRVLDDTLTVTSIKVLQEAYLPPVLALFDGLLSFTLEPETEHWAHLLLREQTRPTAAFDCLYDRFLGRVLTTLSSIVMRLRPGDEDNDARLTVFSMLGQIIVWSTARASAERLLGWERWSEKELRSIKDTLRRSITAQLLA